jgi:UDP-GlcNAc:undecaprenyl-phosphate GlcNAc-1-phosphate transferase
LVSILLGATWVSFLGIWDDRWGLRPILKFVGQIVAAVILIITGVQVGFLPFKFLNWLVTVIWVVGLTNAINFLDNMDGLSGGIAAIASVFFLLMAVQNGQYLVGGLSAALLGASIGFLLYNFNPANIFMGDTGSLFLGFMLAALGIKLRFPDNTDVITWMVPVIVLGVPIFDTTLVVFSRIRRGVHPVTPGKDHTSHRLVRIGFTQREAVMALYLVGGMLGMVAIFVTQADLVEAYLLGGAVFLGAVYGIWRLEKIPPESNE